MNHKRVHDILSSALILAALLFAGYMAWNQSHYVATKTDNNTYVAGTNVVLRAADGR